SLSIFSDLLANITHDIALQSHRSEKLLRTKQQHLHPPTTDGSPPPAATANPLAVVPAEIICSRCHLPQHTAHTLETTTAAAQKKKFCPRLPFQDAPFHDIYGNPFPTVKENAANKKGDSNKSADSPAEDGAAAVAIAPGNGKKGAAVYFKCPCCDKEKVPPNRFAKHLEKCLGLGRKSSRAAMAKMNNSNSGSGAGSPMLSAADATTAQGSKTASRKASPEKKSKSPVPLEEVAVPPPPATPVISSKPIFAASVTEMAAGSGVPTPKKKKKKATAAAAALKVGSVPPEEDKGLLAMPETPTKPIDVPSLTPLPPPILAKEPTTQKKRKRKAETLAAKVEAAATAVGEESREAITLQLSKAPPLKKQKLALGGGEKSTTLDSPKKSQLSKFKNRANSPSPGGTSSKKGETIRKSSPAPHASPPTTHKSLPPKPPTPLTGPLSAAPMVTSSSSQGATPKQRKPKLGTGGSGKKAAANSTAPTTTVTTGDGGGGGGTVVKKVTKPKIKKVVGGVAGKTVPVPRVAGKTVPVPGVARKGPKE
ncbi:hypothetical protein P167DRAFT_533725, partial [Morchella conica CCBAS932]